MWDNVERAIFYCFVSSLKLRGREEEMTAKRRNVFLKSEEHICLRVDSHDTGDKPVFQDLEVRIKPYNTTYFLLFTRKKKEL